jgi:hypothetical protein
MTKKCAFIEESTYGTSAYTAVGNTLINWGKMDFGWQHPWHEEPQTPIFTAAQVVATELVRGQNKLEMNMKYCPVHAWQWKYAGLNTITDGGSGLYTFTPSNTVALKSRTGYFEHDSDIVAALGLVTQDLDFYLEQGQPAIIEEKLVGTQCSDVSSSPGVATATSWPASINSTDVVGWQRINDLEYNDVDLGPTKVHIGLHNFLQKHSGMMKSEAVNYNILSCKRYAMAIVVDFDSAFNGTANDFWAKFKATFTPGSTNDFELKLLWNTSYYWDFDIHNVRFTAAKVDVPAPQEEGADTRYHITGVAYYDGTNAPFTLAVKDGATYS